MITLGSFIGDWQIAREIYHAGGAGGADARYADALRADALEANARFDGMARFSADDAGLLMQETGQMQMAGQTFAATRRYHWRSDGDGIAVHFDDGRFFHRFSTTQTTASHWCDPDRYQVRYDFADWPVWHSVWQVEGPRKSYSMKSRFGRIYDQNTDIP